MSVTPAVAEFSIRANTRVTWYFIYFLSFKFDFFKPTVRFRNTPHVVEGPTFLQMQILQVIENKFCVDFEIAGTGTSMIININLRAINKGWQKN